MKRYKVTVDVTSRWEVSVDAPDEEEAAIIVEGLSADDIEKAGTFMHVGMIESISAFESPPEDDEV